MHEIPQKPTRALVVFNPTAGQAAAQEQAIHEACAVWREAGWQIDLQPTEGPGDATNIARTAAERGYHAVIAAGGDGTVNEVVNGLVGTKAALGTLPVGTVNVWAREIGLPLQPRAAAEMLLRSDTRRIDVGKAGDRYFLLMASLGFDAAVTASVGSDQKRRLGALAYIVEGVKVAFRYQGVRSRVTLDGKTIRGRYLMAVMGNSQLYGGVVKLTADAVIDDGLLDVCLIKGRSLRAAPLRLWSILTRRYSEDPRISYFRAREVNFLTSRPMDVQVDGDHIGTSPMRFSAVPGAIYALLPPENPENNLLLGTYIDSEPITEPSE
ncbi:diacylglycerol kinase family lipid kinase [Chloroflexia bacterium SDU3-3]|nr:diacylglycerol kinase family lipid kinase [Chloroflexia bacterium SDU3-3]